MAANADAIATDSVVLNDLGADGWRVVGVTTKKQLLIGPPAAIILMREVQPAAARAA